MKSWLLVAAAATLAACASTPASDTESVPPAAVTVDPVGVYDFSTTADGTAITGVVTITRTGDKLGGTITTNVTEPIPIQSVTVEATRVNVTSMTPDGPLTFVMDFDGSSFSGTWQLADMSGTHTGRRRTS